MLRCGFAFAYANERVDFSQSSFATLCSGHPERQLMVGAAAPQTPQTPQSLILSYKRFHFVRQND
jgi:hypothetical protein